MARNVPQGLQISTPRSTSFHHCSRHVWWNFGIFHVFHVLMRLLVLCFAECAVGTRCPVVRVPLAALPLDASIGSAASRANWFEQYNWLCLSDPELALSVAGRRSKAGSWHYVRVMWETGHGSNSGQSHPFVQCS